MKKIITLVLVLTLTLVFMSISAVAAPAISGLTITTTNDFSTYTEGQAPQSDAGYTFYGAATTTATVTGGKWVFTSMTSAEKFITRLTVPGAAVPAATTANATYMGYYIENNTANAIGANSMAEHSYVYEEGKEAQEHQMLYDGATDFETVKCFLVDLEGNVTAGTAYEVDGEPNLNGFANIPAGFKGYFLVSLTEGGFDMCLYGAWGDAIIYDCELGKFKPGTSSFTAMGVELQGDIADGENVVVDDIFVADGTLAVTTGGGATTAPNTDGGQPTADVSTIAYAFVAIAGCGALVIRKRK